VLDGGLESDRVAAYAEARLAGLPMPDALRLVERLLAIGRDVRRNFLH
jgi:hypothetical protein